MTNCKITAIVFVITFIAMLSLTSAWSLGNPLSSPCYQETANVSTACGGLSTGSYFYNASTLYIYINYTKPYGASNFSNWTVSHGSTSSERYNITINQSCWDYSSSLVLRIYSFMYGAGASAVSFPSCYNGTTWLNMGTLKSSGAGTGGGSHTCTNQLYDGDWDTYCGQKNNLGWESGSGSPGGIYTHLVYEEAMNWYPEVTTLTSSAIRYFPIPQNTSLIWASMNLSSLKLGNKTADLSVGSGWSNPQNANDSDMTTISQYTDFSLSYLYQNFTLDKTYDYINLSCNWTTNSGTLGSSLAVLNDTKSWIFLDNHILGETFGSYLLNTSVMQGNNISIYIDHGNAGFTTTVYDCFVNVTVVGRPINVNLSINNNIFYTANSFSNKTTNNFANYINSYLSTCSYSEGYCQVPINISFSALDGPIQYSDLQFYSLDGNITNGTTTIYINQTQSNWSESANLTFNVTDNNNLWYSWFVNAVLKLAGYGESVFNYVFNLPEENNTATVVLYIYENSTSTLNLTTLTTTDSVTVSPYTPIGFKLLSNKDILINNITITSGSFNPLGIIIRNSTSIIGYKTIVSNVADFSGLNISFLTGNYYYIEANYSGSGTKSLRTSNNFLLSSTLPKTFYPFNIVNYSAGGIVSSNPNLYAITNITYNLLLTSQSWNITVNSTDPIITIVSPSSNTNVSSNNVNFTLNESFNQTCWYSRNGGANTTFSCKQGNQVSSLLVQGSNNITLYANDTSGNVANSTTLQNVFVDTIYPLISYDSTTKANNSNILGTDIYVGLSVTEINTKNTTLYLYNTTALISNITTETNANGSVIYLFSNLTNPGIYYINATTCDIVSNCNSTATRKISLYNVNITYPNTTIDYVYNNQNISFNYTINNASALSSCWFSYNGTTRNLASCKTNSSFLMIDGVETIIFYSNDTINNVETTTRQFNISYYEPNNSRTFNTTSLETKSERISITLWQPLGASTPSTNLIFDGLPYASTETSSINSSSCYQESANVSTSCGGLSTGLYANSGNWSDGNWNTYQTLNSTYIYVNYTKPTGIQSSVWTYKGSSGNVSTSIPATCLVGNTLQIKIAEETWTTGDSCGGKGGCIFHTLVYVSGLKASCYDNSNWVEITKTNGEYNLYEEGITWSGVNKKVITLSNTKTMPTSPGNYSFYWQINPNTTISNISVGEIKFGICNATLNKSYINFTFKDETTLASINASADLTTWSYWLGDGSITKSYLFTNTTTNPSYAFCFSPSSETLNIDLAFQYSSTGYPQRYYVRTGTLTNATTNHTLYLLGSSYGIYTTFVTQSPIGNAPISGVTITAERQFSGVWTQVGQQITDTSGSATFWLNPNYDHRITASKTGYDTTISTIRPTQSLYTIFMGSGISETNYTFKGIDWSVGPKSTNPLNLNTSYTFFFNVSSTQSNLINCKFELRNYTGSVVATAIGVGYNSGANCLATTTFSMNTSGKVFGYYYLDLGDGYALLKANDGWIFESGSNTGRNFNLFDLLNNFADLEDFGDTHNKQEFSKIVAFFFVIIILIGAFTYNTGYDFAQPGSALILLWGLILMASFAGIFYINGLSYFEVFNKYTIAAVTTFITWGFLLDHWRRSSQ